MTNKPLSQLPAPGPCPKGPPKALVRQCKRNCTRVSEQAPRRPNVNRNKEE